MTDVLIVDDDSAFGPELANYVRQEGYSARTAATLHDARTVLAEGLPELLLIDLQLPDGSGLDLIRELPNGGGTQVVVLTGYPSVDSAVEGLRANIADYMTKPIDMQLFHDCLTRVCGVPRIQPPLQEERRRFRAFVGNSKAMRRVYLMIGKVAQTDATVLVQGESGTGKELVAQAIHTLSARSHAPFLALNCGAVPQELIGNELFGHERGGYTGASRQHKGYFERAQGGTLLLDEITEMPLELQVNLLRVLETGKLTRIGGDKEIDIDVRLVAATNRDARRAVADGRLREDLFYRLQVFPIHMPPLRERLDDIPLLVEHFLGRLNAKAQSNKRMTDGALACMARHAWPGNVRELKNMLHRIFILSEHDIQAALLLQMPEFANPSREIADDEVSALNGNAIMNVTPLEDAERRLILDTLAECNG
ncbi:MAG: sigma-54-dependent Fis family transcriptional regulator, partial [Gammaproteobacteria bacterium]|nr:sigma-54-dependent Fis family transcriptional regulator [Gammaproteobacteria bacterium]